MLQRITKFWNFQKSLKPTSFSIKTPTQVSMMAWLLNMFRICKRWAALSELMKHPINTRLRYKVLSTRLIFSGTISELSLCFWLRNTATSGSSHIFHYCKIGDNDLLVHLAGDDENKIKVVSKDNSQTLLGPVHTTSLYLYTFCYTVYFG